MNDLFKLKQREITISPSLTIKLKEQTIFLADGSEGLHLWESSVVLTRYCLLNESLFHNKNIIELGCGCGLLGISLLKQFPSIQLTFSDYQDTVLNNLNDNIKMNNITNTKYDVLKCDWREYQQLQEGKYDIIVGAELVYKGGAIKELAYMIKRILNKNGKCFISMPLKRSMTDEFKKYVEECGMVWKGMHFKDANLDEQLFGEVLKNKKESKKLFDNLKDMDIMLYTIEHNNNI
jgi:ribosomal protein L11 methylase PrmA